VPEVAAKARVSRATAYRYFPSRSALVTAVVGEALAPVRRFEPRSGDGLQRMRELFDKTFPLFKEFEPHMRAALQLSLEHESLARLGLLEEEPYRRGHRRYMLHRAAAPLRARLGERTYERLIKALSLIYGIESYVVLRDIWGSSYRDVEAVARWMVDALIESALRQARKPAAPPTAPLPAGRGSPPARRQRRGASRPLDERGEDDEEGAKAEEPGQQSPQRARGRPWAVLPWAKTARMPA
jgi:AcrR family transcriptional regulator